MHLDELARLVKMDALEFRLKNLKDPRLRAVLEAAAKAFGWGKAKAEGRGHGIACGTEKGSFVATCAEIAVDRERGSVQVLRVVAAFECGAIVNPGHLKNQIKGNRHGPGGALFEAIEFENAHDQKRPLSKYRVPRFADAPAIEVVLLDRKDLPSAGAGETPIIGIAPGRQRHLRCRRLRLNSLPMAPNGLKA
jgi:isoquinoline 1-oxidoreductase